MPKFIFGTLTVALLSLSSFANAQVATEKSPIQIKVSSTGADSSARYSTLLKFKEDMNKRFGDKVEIIVVSPVSAYKEGEEFEALGFDLVNIIVPSSSKVAEEYDFKDLYLFDLPFLFRTSDDVLRYLKSPLPDKIIDSFIKKEHLVTPLAFWIGDYKNFYGNRHLKTTQDFQGLTGSVETNNGISNIYQKSLGLSTVRAQNQEQLVSSIVKPNNNSPDVVELNSSFILNKELYKYYKDLTKSQHIVRSYMVLTNKRWFNKLPEDVKSGIKDITKDLTVYHFEQDKKINEEALEKLKSEGLQIHTWSKEDKEKFVQKAVSAHEHYLQNIDSQYLQEVYKTVR